MWCLPMKPSWLPNLALRPLPTLTVVQTLNNCLSTSLHGTSVPTQGQFGSVRWYQSHLNHSALLDSSKYRIPRPPSFFGFWTLAHQTRQCPPWACSAFFHKKPLLILSILFIAHFFRWKTVRKYVGIKDTTMLSSLNLPALLTNLSFQVDSLFASL